jgi:hypothetical protein
VGVWEEVSNGFRTGKQEGGSEWRQSAAEPAECKEAVIGGVRDGLALGLS